MRALALLLILANLGFLGWSQLVDVRRSQTGTGERVGAAATPRLVLSTEVRSPVGEAADAAPATAASTTLPRDPAEPAGLPAASTPNDLECISVGAFRDLAEAAQASAALQSAGYFSRQRVEQGEVWLGYWVSVQNLSSRAAAEQALAELAQRGITDAYIIPGSEPANTLSLGVFNDPARAQRRVEEIRALGLAAQVADRRRAGSVYWLDVDLPGPGAQFDSAVLQTQPGKIVRLEFRACPEDSGTAATPPPEAAPSQ